MLTFIKKQHTVRLFCLILALLMLLCACGKNNGGDTATTEADPTSDATGAPTEKPTEQPTEQPTEKPTEQPTTGKPDVPPDPPTDPDVLEVKWNAGYVGSSGNSSGYVNKINNAGGAYFYTDVITIPKAGTTITFSDANKNDGGDGKYTSSAAYVFSSWKKEGNNWVIDLDRANYAGSGTSLSQILISYQNGAVTYSYTTSVDNENLRLCYRGGKATVHPEVTAKYTGKEGTAKDKITLPQWIEESKKTSYYEILEGLTVNAIGDSYFAGSDIDPMMVWLHLMEKKYGQSMTNHGIGGSTVSTYVDKNAMCNRFQKLPSNNPQIVLIEGGRNDFNQKAPIGTVNSTDKSTFMGALNVVIDGVQEKYPDAMIVCITPWNFPDKSGYTLTYKDYVNAMMAVAEAQGVYCINASDPAVSGVDMRDDAFRAKYNIKPSDVSHLNADGMKLVLPYFEKALAECYEQFLKTAEEEKPSTGNGNFNVEEDTDTGWSPLIPFN